MRKAPMGWNSWDCYGTAVDEETVRRNAELLASDYLQSGYDTVVVDIQWSCPTAKNHEYQPFAVLCMDDFGRLLPAENRFPSAAGGKGFRPLADYVHGLGLKFGIHIMRGIPRQAVHADCKVLGTHITAKQIAKTNSFCDWNPDMYGIDPQKDGAREYYNSMFALYADWGVDFIKCDDICREMPACEEELILLSECLHACGRPMTLSLSPGAALPEYAELYKRTADMWRISDDFWDDWKALYHMFSLAERWSGHIGGNTFPDADMLPVGAILQDYGSENRSKFTPDELRTMMTLWCMIRSPLFIGGELSKMTDAEKALLTDPDLLEIHRTVRFARQHFRRIVNRTEYAVWLAGDGEGTYYAAVFNLSDVPAEGLLMEAEEFGMETLDAVSLRDGKPQHGGCLVTGKLPAHGCEVLKFREL